MLLMSHSKLRMSNAPGCEIYHSQFLVFRLTDAKVQQEKGEINSVEWH